MNCADFLNAVIDDGISEVSQSYLKPDQFEKRDGAIQAFEDCRGKTIAEIIKLKDPADRKASELRQTNTMTNYWYLRYYVLQIEWVHNVYAAKMMLEERPMANANVTARGMNKACEIMGIPA